jgi:uncharacterized repeat protein (TIGR03803 family)
MRTISNSAALLGLAGFLLATGAPAATFTNFYIFSADAFGPGPNPPAINSDGVSPDGLVVSGNTVYGTALGGGLYGDGTIFRVDTDGTHFTNLFNFNLGTYDPQNVTYPDSTGDYPNPGLLLLGNTLYGTTFYGGVFDAGTVFRINTDGSGFAVVFSFAFTNGQSPSSGLTLYNNTLYGTTTGGGTNQSGTVFSINLADLSFAKIYDFTNDAELYGGLVVSSNALYGFARFGASGNGYAYRIGLAGGFTHLFDFDGTNASRPYSTPTLSGDTLFGISYSGGIYGGGNVFRIDTDGRNYTNLYSFPRQSGANTTGANPNDLAGLVLSGNVLYGTTSVSGTGGQGTVFQLNTDGSGFTILHSFQYTDGAEPESLVLSGGTLYGMTSYGFQGISLGDGGVYALILQPALNLALSGNQSILTWNDPSYFLYTAPTITNVFTKVTGAGSPYTNSVAGTQKFFQLRPN